MSKEEKFDKDIDLEKYQSPDEPSLKELNFGLWLAENRKRLRGLLVIILIIISLGLFIYSAYSYFIYSKSSNTAEQVLNSSLPQSPKKLVSNLKIYPLRVFSGSSSSDLAVKIDNPNDKFMAYFNYCFSQGAKSLICGQDYIMPSEQKYVLALAQTLNNPASNIKFKLKNISWHRIDAHKIPDWNNYSRQRLNFLITDLKFTPAQSNDLSRKIGLNSLEFSIKNQSPYGYYELPLNLLFFSQGNLVGVNRYFLENFLSGEEQKVKLVWTGNLFGVDQTKIQPDINLISSKVYTPYKGTISN